MGLILGGLALAIALISLWMVGDARRMIVSRNTDFLQAYVKPIKQAAFDNQNDINSVRKDAKRYRDIIETLADRIGEVEDKNRLLTNEVKTLTSELNVSKGGNQKRRQGGGAG